jgi:hypothetical protein
MRTCRTKPGMRAAFYGGSLWKGELEQVLLPMLDTYEVVLVETPHGLGSWE